MYTVSEKGAELIMSDCRSFRARMIFTNGTELQDEIVDINFSMQSSADDIRPGDVIPRNLSAQLTGITSTLAGQTFRLYFDILDVSDNLATHGYLNQYTHGELHEYTHGAMPGTPAKPEAIPAGKYKVTACTKQGDRWSLEAHCLLYASDKPYTSRLTYPTTLANVERELCNGLGIDLPQSSASITIYSKISGATYREMLGYLAALQGKCCITDREGRLAYKGLEETGYVITPSRAADPDVSQESVTIAKIVCTGAGGHDYTIAPAGRTGRTLAFEDPLVDSRNFSQMASSLGRWLSLSFTPLTVPHNLGDPRLDILDYVTVQRFEDGAEFKVPLTSISLSFDGGISCELAATASSDKQEETKQQNVRPMSKRIAEAADQAASQVEAEMQDKINDIVGENGGYVIQRFNSDGQPIATYYTDNLDPDQASDVLLINHKGIAGTDQGIVGPFNVAISIDGTINASRILTGILTAIKIQSLNYSAKAGSTLDLQDGTFSYGGGKLTYYNDTLSMKNAKITGGSLKVETDDETYDVIDLSCNEWEGQLTPLQVRMSDSQKSYEAILQNSGLWFKYLGNNRMTISIAGSITTPNWYIASNGDISTQGGLWTEGVVLAGGNVSASGNVKAGGNSAVSGVDGAVFANDLYWKDSDSATGYRSMRTFYDYVMNYINNHP